MWLEQPLPVGPPTQAAVGTAGRHLLFKSLLLGGGGLCPVGRLLGATDVTGLLSGSVCLVR